MTLVGLAHDWALAALGMLLFGVGWTSAYATIQAAAQLVCPPWVRARSLSIYQLAQNGALTVGSFFWGGIGGTIGLHPTFLLAAAVGIILTILAAWLYAGITGWQEPVLRSASGMTLFGIGRCFFREGRLLNILAGIAILLGTTAGTPPSGAGGCRDARGDCTGSGEDRDDDRGTGKELKHGREEAPGGGQPA